MSVLYRRSHIPCRPLGAPPTIPPYHHLSLDHASSVHHLCRSRHVFIGRLQSTAVAPRLPSALPAASRFARLSGARAGGHGRAFRSPPRWPWRGRHSEPRAPPTSRSIPAATAANLHSSVDRAASPTPIPDSPCAPRFVVRGRRPPPPLPPPSRGGAPATPYAALSPSGRNREPPADSAPSTSTDAAMRSDGRATKIACATAGTWNERCRETGMGTGTEKATEIEIEITSGIVTKSRPGEARRSTWVRRRLSRSPCRIRSPTRATNPYWCFHHPGPGPDSVPYPSLMSGVGAGVSLCGSGHGGDA